VAFWIFHGAKDDIVDPAHSEKMYQALRAEGANVKFSLYPEANHNSWDPAFAEPEFMSWLFSKSK
jgi:dipeptidyl aminopeptidase/acylaminoacyl peptidase